MSVAISRRTQGIVLGSIVYVAIIAAIVGLGIGGDDVTLAVSDLGELIAVAFAAAVVLWVALTFAPDEPMRGQWLPIGLGIASFAVGDALWSYMELVQGIEPPYPGITDLFYLLEYPLIGFGLFRAAIAYRGLVDLKRPALTAAGTVAALAALLWAVVLVPQILQTDLSAAEKAVSLFYPTADVLLYLGLGLFVAFVVRTLGRGKLAWPWWAVVTGVVVLAFADTGYSVMEAYDLYESGAIVDYGWSVAHLAIAVGASIAYDLAHPVALKAVRPAVAPE